MMANTKYMINAHGCAKSHTHTHTYVTSKPGPFGCACAGCDPIATSDNTATSTQLQFHTLVDGIIIVAGPQVANH